MRAAERRVAEALAHEARVCAEAEERVWLARKALGNKCQHPPEHVVESPWEHDNGYGRQSMIVGLRCVLCKARKDFQAQGYWTRDGEMLP